MNSRRLDLNKSVVDQFSELITRKIKLLAGKQVAKNQFKPDDQIQPAKQPYARIYIERKKTAKEQDELNTSGL